MECAMKLWVGALYIYSLVIMLFSEECKHIRKYLLTEAREKNRPEFLQGWQTAVTKVSK